MKKKTVRTILFNVLIAALAIFWIIPIVWLVCTSFSAADGMNVSTFFPKAWSAVHYAQILHSDSVNQFTTWFWNTFKIACFTCVISTFFVLMVAYATSVMRFKMRKPLMNLAVILNLFPGMLAMIAVYFTLRTFQPDQQPHRPDPGLLRLLRPGVSDRQGVLRYRTPRALRGGAAGRL